MEDAHVELTNWGDLDRRHVWHPYTQMLTAPEPIRIVGASGSRLFTDDGRSLLDAISSWWVTLHAHAHPAIAAAIARQAALLEQVIFAGFTHEPAARLAGALAGVLPGDLERVFFSDNGSTAVEVALKMCIQYWSNRGEERRRFLALEDAYHGDTFGAMSVSARSVFTASFDRHLFDVARLAFPADDASAARMLEQAQREIESGDVAGIIVEPLLLGAGGMRVWRAEHLAQLAELAREHATPLIADEVLTGFGRTGRMFAIEHASIVPDIVCLSKGITGGFLPLGATVCRPHIFEAFLSEDPRRTLFHGHSYTANPIACAAALASLEVFESERTMERVERIAALHRERIAHIATLPGIRSPRTLGTIAAFDLAVDEPGYLNPVGRRVAERALDAGIYLRPLGNTLYLLPPYCTTNDELHSIYDLLDDALVD
jgi:adenosylmethionine-8-amino-7-oxononanoate aminotransferase